MQNCNTNWKIDTLPDYRYLLVLHQYVNLLALSWQVAVFGWRHSECQRMSKLARGRGMGNESSLARSDRAFDDYVSSVKYFTEHEALLRKKYPDKWVAIHKGHVRAIADTFSALVKEIDEKKIPSAETLARKLDSRKRTLIL